VNIDCPKSTDLFALDLFVILFVIVANVAAAAMPRENLDIKSLRVSWVVRFSDISATVSLRSFDLVWSLDYFIPKASGNLLTNATYELYTT
jgi:hypothetical protein